MTFHHNSLDSKNNALGKTNWTDFWVVKDRHSQSCLIQYIASLKFFSSVIFGPIWWLLRPPLVFCSGCCCTQCEVKLHWWKTPFELHGCVFVSENLESTHFGPICNCRWHPKPWVHYVCASTPMFQNTMAWSPNKWFENMVSGTRSEKCIFQSYAIGADTYVIVSALPSSSIRHNGNSKRVFFWLPFPNHETTRLWKANLKWHHKWQNHSWKPKKKRRWSHRASESFESWVNVWESTNSVWGTDLYVLYKDLNIWVFIR